MNLKPVTLKKLFTPNYYKNLIRLGRHHDGGYLVCKNDMIDSGLLLSFGISDDWSFEKDYYELTKNQVLSYDGSTNLLFWSKYFLSSLIKFNFKRCLKFFEFYLFFRNRKSLSTIFINKLNFNKIFYKALKINSPNSKIFLKIDIEGSEYEILDDLVKLSPHLNGLIIEFHDFINKQNEVINFIKDFKLNIAHIHVNNYGKISYEGIPEILEISFTQNKSNFKVKPKLPNKLDMPNNPNHQEIKIEFS